MQRPSSGTIARSGDPDTEALRQARDLAASIDAAAEDLERNGPVSREELAAMLHDLEHERAQEEQAVASEGGPPRGM